MLILSYYRLESPGIKLESWRDFFLGNEKKKKKKKHAAFETPESFSNDWGQCIKPSIFDNCSSPCRNAGKSFALYHWSGKKPATKQF